MEKLSHSFSGSLRSFSYWLANGTVGYSLLDDIEYSCIFEEPSALEQVYAIFANVIEMDENGIVLNARHAEKRATQYIRRDIDKTYVVEPPFEDWELELY